MLTCIIDYIGLEYCAGAYEPVAYLNSLPGISIESLDKTADSEQVTYLGVWEDVQSNAARQFKNDVIGQLRNCYELSKDCDYEEMICDNLEILLDSWMYLCAIWVMTFRLSSDRLTRYTTVDRDQAAELRSEYEAKYRNALEQSVKLMDISSCEMCCNPNPVSVTWLP